MKIAVTYNTSDNTVFAHFGRTAHFRIVTIDGGAAVSDEIAAAAGEGHAALASFLADKGVTSLLCGRIGEPARNALTQAGLAVYSGVSGDADEAIAALVTGTLRQTDSSGCDDTCCAKDNKHNG